MCWHAIKEIGQFWINIKQDSTDDKLQCFFLISTSNVDGECSSELPQYLKCFERVHTIYVLVQRYKSLRFFLKNPAFWVFNGVLCMSLLTLCTIYVLYSFRFDMARSY